MFIEALVIISNKWKQARCFQKVNEETNCGISWQWNIILFEEEINYQTMKRHQGKLNSYH